MENKVAFITGGTTGIGAAIARQLAKDGFAIAVNNITLKEEFQKEIEKYGVPCFMLQGDVSREESAQENINAVFEHYGRIDVLVNNAGITRDNLLMRMKEEEFESVINVNLKGSYHMMRYVVPIMMKQRSGRIISIASVVGVKGNAGQINYSASKAGIIGMTKSLAQEVASRNILVNAVAPGFIRTPMTDQLNDTQKQNILSQIGLKRMGTAEDIANAVSFLASDKSSYITGQTLVVDGGMIY